MRSNLSRNLDLKHPLTARFTKALALAAHIHRLQARKGTQVPYMAHILGVASIALEHGANEDEAIAAVLHDAIEDAPKRLGATAVRGAIEERFGADVLMIVEGCTDTDIQPKPPWMRRKEQYVRRIAHEDASTLLVSASDKLHNVRAILSDVRAEGIGFFDRFNKEAGMDGTIGYYRGLVIAFRKRNERLEDPRLPRLLDELDRTVTALEHEVGVVGKWPPR
jgi:(p)ppGpp synthase/HD superfamily hydrolase